MAGLEKEGNLQIIQIFNQSILTNHLSSFIYLFIYIYTLHERTDHSSNSGILESHLGELLYIF